METTQAPTYPDWQATIRAKQALHQAMLAEKERVKQAEQSAKQAELDRIERTIAHEFHQKLMEAGLETLPPLTSLEWDFGSYQWRGDYHTSGILQKVYQPQTLFILKPVPDTVPSNVCSDNNYRRVMSMAINFNDITAVRLADALDDIEAGIQQAIIKNAQILAELQAPVPTYSELESVQADLQTCKPQIEQKFFTCDLDAKGEKELAELKMQGWRIEHNQFTHIGKMVYTALLERHVQDAPATPAPEHASVNLDDDDDNDFTPAAFAEAIELVLAFMNEDLDYDEDAEEIPDEDYELATDLPRLGGQDNGASSIVPIDSLGTISQALLRGENPNADLLTRIAANWKPFDVDAHMAKLRDLPDTPNRFSTPNRPTQISITLDGSPDSEAQQGASSDLLSNKPISQLLRTHGLTATKAALDAAMFTNFTPQAFSLIEVQS